MIREPFLTQTAYHVLNRGVEKRVVFLDDSDRRRFYLSLIACNSIRPVRNLSAKLTRSEIEVPPRLEQLVYIMAYSLMPNHYHLLLRQARDGGVELFMRKLGTGYTMYFNKRYDRVGPLFQGVFKAIAVTDQRHLNYLPHYVHANSLDTIRSSWREGKVDSSALQHISQYRWSSYPHYIGTRKDPVIDDRSIIESFGSLETVTQSMTEWLHDMNEKSNPALFLE